MKLFRSKLCLLLLVAEPGQAVEWLNWAQCVAEARVNNPELKAVRSEVDKSQYQVDEAKSAFRPQVAAKAEASHNRSGSPLRGDEQYSYGISVNQSLFAGYSDEATIDQRQELAAGAKAREEQATAQAEYDLRSAFVEHLHAQQLIEVQRTTAARRREQVRLVSLRFNGGRENKGAVLKSEATAKLAVVDEAQAVRQLDVARMRLARALGRPTSSETLVKGELAPVAAAAPEDLTVLAAATPAHREAAAALRAAKSALTVAYGANYPDLSAFASVTRSGNWPPDENRFAVGLAVSVPLYTGGAQTARVRSAASESERAEYNVAATHLATLTELHVANAELQGAIERVEAQNDVLEAAKVQAEIARNQYNLGLISFQDWDSIENALIEAERTLLASRRSVALAQAAWDKAQGQGFNETL